jgi:IS1 family transposase
VASGRPADSVASPPTRSRVTAGSPASTPRPPTTSSWSFPPRTTEVQFDEKWSFVAKKEANCDRSDPADDRKGDCWDHVAFDPEHKLVVAVVPGKRTAENTEALVAEFRRRTGGRLMGLMTSDDYPAYETAILHAYGQTITPPRTGKRGRPRAPYQVPPPGLTYATVTKRREKGRVVKIGTRIVFGTIAAVLAALAISKVSRAINTAFVERENGTDRHRNARKARKSYRFSKDWRYHEAVTFLSLYCYNFCWPVRTLTTADAEGRRVKRSPAMAAGLTDHIWSMAEWLSRPAVQHS